MEFNYFYGNESEQFSFYRIPKSLFTDEHFHGLSVESKILYGLLLDRISLSKKNGWTDKAGRVYIIFTLDEVMQALGCANQKASRLLKELDSIGLIERRRLGLGNPDIIYVKSFIVTAESHFCKCENHISAEVEITSAEPLKSHTINTEKNNTDMSDTDSLRFTSFSDRENHETMRSEVDKREELREQIKRNIAYDALIYDYPSEKEGINEILELLVDTVCCNKPSIRISGDEKPTAAVRDVFMQLNSEHIRFVLNNLNENTTQVRCIKQYLLATLYNSFMTIDSAYKCKVQSEFTKGFFKPPAAKSRDKPFDGSLLRVSL